MVIETTEMTLTIGELKVRLVSMRHEIKDLIVKMAGNNFGFEYPWRPESLERIKKNNPTNYARYVRYHDLKSKEMTLRDEYQARTGQVWEVE
jgi:hypothetical protein